MPLPQLCFYQQHLGGPVAESKVSLCNPLQASFPSGGQLVRAYLGTGGWWWWRAGAEPGGTSNTLSLEGPRIPPQPHGALSRCVGRMSPERVSVSPDSPRGRWGQHPWVQSPGGGAFAAWDTSGKGVRGMRERVQREFWPLDVTRNPRDRRRAQGRVQSPWSPQVCPIP